MRTIGIVTVGRSDYSIYLPILKRLREDPTLHPCVIAAGAHFSQTFGLSARAIEADGFEIQERVEIPVSSDTPEGIARSMAEGLSGFAQAYARVRPDLLLLAGDRFEMHSAAAAAVPFNIPLAHLHGGEITEGAIDNVLRHSITKMSHLHFVSTEEHGRRVMQMGEEPWRVKLSGAPSLDNLRSIQWLSREELSDRFGLRLDTAPLVATYHSETLEYEQAEGHTQELLAALEAVNLPVVFTVSNNDTNGGVIRRLIADFVSAHPRTQMVESLGTQGYFSLLKHAAAMVGNSSSGLVEAPSFGLPVVNIGDRQTGRTRAANVIDVGHAWADIVEAIRKATDEGFRKRLRGMSNPFGDGCASERIVSVLRDVTLDRRLLVKRFVDHPASALAAVPAKV